VPTIISKKQLFRSFEGDKQVMTLNPDREIKSHH